VDIDEFRRQSRDTWESVAAGWESRHEFLSDNMGLVNDWIIDRTSPASGQVILEVGAGPGDLGHRIAEMVEPGGRVISTDFATAMVDVARRLGANRGLENVEYRQLDAGALDLPDQSIDAIVSRSVYMLLADPAGALREARRVLRPAGSLTFSVFTVPDENPWFAVPAGVFVQRGHLEPPRPGIPGVFALGTPTRVEALLADASFDETVTEPIDFAFHYTGADDAWRSLLDLTGPLAVLAARLPADALAATRAAVIDGFAPFRRADGSLDVPAQALAIHAV